MQVGTAVAHSPTQPLLENFGPATSFHAHGGAMEGMTGSDDKGSENDESLHGSNRKKRKSSGAEKDHSASVSPDSKGHDGEKVGPKKSKKVREEAEDLHAETQRLLRETPGTSFAPEQAMRKPVSSLIEKIRQRKLQLSHSVTKTSISTLGSSSKVSTLYLKVVKDESTKSVDTEQGDFVEFVMSKPPTRPVVKQDPGVHSISVPRDESNEIQVPVDDMDEAEGVSSQPSTPDIRSDWSNSNSLCKSPPKSALRAPVLESQDLYSDSQLSVFKDDDEDNIPVLRTGVNLHLDSETQDDDRWLEEDEEKENKDPSVTPPPEHIPIVSHARGLIDDEAEDEDDDDDDSSEDEGDEGQETAGELQDLLAQDAGEKPADVERRTELHSKWLEQQDLAMEDNILHRIESGWKNKGKKEMPALLCDSQERASQADDMGRTFRGIDRLAESAPGNIASSLDVHKKQVKDDTGLLRGATSYRNIDQDIVDSTQQDDYQESSDDEEAEENLRRQLYLQESEEKTEFLSVADDESSREVFGLIKKVNVATIKSRTTTAHNEVRASAAVCHPPPSLQHQSSFLRRKATSTSATTRQGSGNSRSYVFGRDDSNSRDASRLDNKEQTEKAKAKAIDEQKSNSNSQSTPKCASSGSKGGLSKETQLRGPSLFQVLKQQAEELKNGKTLDLSGSSTRGDNLSIFMAIKPSRQPRGSRGT